MASKGYHGAQGTGASLSDGSVATSTTAGRPDATRWLNMAEIEFSVFGKQCLARRIGDEEALKREVGALEAERNQAKATIIWRFSTRDARDRLHHIYPSISN